MDLTNAPWRKSSYSANGGDTCVEVAPISGHVAVRDTKARDRGHLVVSRSAWRQLVDRARKE